MTHTLIYLSGEPGVGKSSLMAELTRPWTRLPVNGTPDGPARDLLIQADPADLTPRVVAVELGRRRDSFSGTDALPQTVINVAELYLTTGKAAEETSLLLAEGARLANRRFLQAALEADWRLIFVHLANPAAAGERRRARAAALGVPEQHPSWVLGRRTSATNLAAAVAEWGCTVLTLDAAQPLDHLAGVLRPVIGALV